MIMTYLYRKADRHSNSTQSRCWRRIYHGSRRVVPMWKKEPWYGFDRVVPDESKPQEVKMEIATRICRNKGGPAREKMWFVSFFEFLRPPSWLFPDGCLVEGGCASKNCNQYYNEKRHLILVVLHFHSEVARPVKLVPVR
jgi:hypothetical protein